MEKKKIKLVLGLGNPEAKYKNTYHNVGVAFIARHQERAKEELVGLQFLISEHFMNKSGLALNQALRQSNISLEECLVVHDDSDLEIGKYKLSFGSGDAGHNGIKSIVEQFGSQDFWRLRIGIRNANEETRKPAGDFVLSKIGENEKTLFERVFKEAFEELKNIA